MFVETWLPSILSRKHRMLHASIIFFAIPYFYSYYNDQHRLSSYSVEQAMSIAWEHAIVRPSTAFKKVVVGFNANVDLIVPGVQLVESLNTTIESDKDHEVIESLAGLHETFAHFFRRGAAAERYMSDEEQFRTVVRQAEGSRRANHHIGGNAALMADRIAMMFPSTDVHLVGPIGPRAQALLHPAVKRTNSTRIVKDELHVIMEYRQGEILGDWVAPSSSRFITSHDHYSGSTIVMEMFFAAAAKFKPELVILTGVHLLEFQKKEIRLEKLRMIKRNLMQMNSKLPVHWQLGSLGDPQFLMEIINKVLPYVDSIGLNEQELAFLSHVTNGPHMEAYPVQAGTVHVHKVVEMLHWILRTFGRPSGSNPDPQKQGYRLQRIHFHCLTYHILVTTGTDWTNSAAGLAAGARLAGKISCNLNRQSNIDTDLLEVRTAHTMTLDRTLNKQYHFDPHNPMSSWMRDDMLFIFTPVLVCRFPTKTVGVEDAIAATGLLYSQFYKFESKIRW